MSRRRSYPYPNPQGSRPGRPFRGRQGQSPRHEAYRGNNGQRPTREPPRGFSGRAQKWIRMARRWLGNWFTRGYGGMESDSLVIGGAGMGLGALLNGMDWENVRTDVERESRAHVILVGAEGAGKTTLLHRLKGLEEGTLQPVSFQDDDKKEVEGVTELDEIPNIENFGFFAVLDLSPGKPPSQAANGYFAGDGVWNELENADLIVWVLDALEGLRAWEYEWISRVRGAGKPLLVVANKLDQMKESNGIARWQQALGVEIIPISAREGTNVMTQLVPQMADAIPTLATALGREVVEWRRTAAQRVMRRAATLSGLVGLEPVPLLDLPFQISIQLQMVLRLAAIYGQPLRDQYSREMLATMVSAVGIRFAGGQLVKAIPLVGWVASGVLAAGGSWVIGRIALGYFEHGRKVNLPRLKRNASRAETPIENDNTQKGKEKKSGRWDVLERMRGFLGRRLKRDKADAKEGGENERETV